MRYQIAKCLVTVITFVLLCFPSIVQAASGFSGETNIFFIGEYLDWKEFGDNTQRVVRETGPRFGIGASHNFEFIDHQLIVKPLIEVTGGQVNYDGLVGASVPVKTESSYFGGKIELDLGWRFGLLQRISIEPFGGIGYRGWYKHIHGATASDGVTGLDGYTEEWYTAYGRVGLRGNLALGEKIYLFAEGGGKLPFYTEQIAHLEGPNATVRPKNRASLFAETGIRYKYVKASVYYESMRFGRSKTISTGSIDYYQPNTKADMFGFRLGASF